MEGNLESKINQEYNFKSAGERRIAEILNKYGIDFKYESPVLVNDNQGKQRIWYPDFYLPEFGVYIENYGIDCQPGYDNGRIKKQQIYRRMGLPVIPIMPSDKHSYLGNYIVNEIYRINQSRYHDARAKVYRLRTMPRMGY
jgi:hypothetical protein